ncbi:histidine phosphatase family protein [Azospirillum soli]|uniref:histidine phosphatase family protein n=1 Tax=Azospirillum soli TaxID=1304799 RepID=UPI001AEB45B3|nr:histidine phosphatase family protein [Azospirillum soli]MBP2315723.1 broad specificity phosphatase PhoE [Azospirillum soli]
MSGPHRRWVVMAMLIGVAAASFAQDITAAELRAGDVAGLVVLMRHAEAPGIGDPAGFRLDDCATQRNLSEDGRQQARRIGERLRRLGIRKIAVYSSQWCRCLETARLLGVGAVREMPAINSFFGRNGERDAQMAELRRFLAGLPAGGPPVVLVTHQVVVTALTGVHPASGEAVLLRANSTTEPAVIGRLAAGPDR